MRILLCVAFILVGCENTTSPVNLAKPILKSPENPKIQDQSQQQGDTKVATQQNSGTQSQTTGEVKVPWGQFGTVPNDFVSPVQHFTFLGAQSALVVDKAGKSFMLNSDDKSVVPLVRWVRLTHEADTLALVQTSESSAWHLRSDLLQWIQWEENGTDHKKISTTLTALFDSPPPKDVKLMSPRVDQVLVVGADVRVHVQRVEDQLKVKRYSGLNEASLNLASPTGHLFEYSNGSLSRFLEVNAPVLAKQTVTVSGLPTSAVGLKFDVFGSDERLETVGLAVVDGFFWMSVAGKVGSTVSTIVSQEDSGADRDFTSVVEPFLVKHCGSCHEGRAPVFIRTDAGVKKALVDVVRSKRKEIKFRVTLPESDGRVMPPYPPFPTADEWSSVAEWFQ